MMTSAKDNFFDVSWKSSLVLNYGVGLVSISTIVIIYNAAAREIVHVELYIPRFSPVGVR